MEYSKVKHMTGVRILILHKNNYIPFLVWPKVDKHRYHSQCFPKLLTYCGVSKSCAVYVCIKQYSAWVIYDVNLDVSHCYIIVLVLLKGKLSFSEEGQCTIHW